MVENSYSTRNWLITAVIFSALFLVIEVTDVKFLLADYIYRLEGFQWSLRDHFITKDILHNGVRELNFVAIALVLFLTIYHYSPFGRREKRRRYTLLLLSLLLSFGIVNYLKATLGMDCPWDLSLYGGAKPYVDFWSFRESSFAPGRCFPAGHSSIGFSWLALYFFWKNNRITLAKFALVSSIVVGFSLGLVQQLRGAHFFLDDITTAFICWSVSFFIHHFGKHHEANQR
ncbi:phosphatase PAP2 family protein [Pseudidiomarina tainanensis]|uniref:phosphatase PAP2 family protein n=1 Tax=Pseudidiomarina tainanensis TaxID=502365 RepID=UPI001F45467F|nr:phosphatase PAP2 family protein [Pseudidiomarina tainanensis]